MSYLKLFVVMLGLGLLLRPTFICAAPKALSPRSLSALMDQGHQALLAKEYKAARDDFSDIIYADPRNQLALDGATFAYLELDDFAHAKTCYERLQTVSSIPSRPSAINGAAIYLHFKMSMRSIKILMQYMKPMPQVDELALNALAISINQADDHARKATLYSEGVTFYIAKNKKLEATRPGEKRWGTEWLPADEADKKNAAWLEKINSTSSQAVELASLKAQYDAGEKAPGPLVFDADLGKYRTWHTNEWQLKRLQTQIDTMQAELDKAQASVERPPIPDEITPLSVVADNAPQVASASDRKSSSQPQAPQPSETPAPAPATLPAVALVPPVPSPTPAPADPGANKPAAPDTEIPAKKTYRVTTYATAFPVAPDLLVTTADAVADASDIQIQDADGTPFPATLVRADPDTGLALVRVVHSKFGCLTLADQFPGGALSCVSFPNVDLFQPSAALIAGSATAPRASWKVRLSESPRLGGGPLLAQGKVVGVELAERDSEATAIPCVTLDDLRKFLGADAAGGPIAGDAVAATFQLSAVRIR